MSLISGLYGSVTCWQWFSCVCSKLVNQNYRRQKTINVHCLLLPISPHSCHGLKIQNKQDIAAFWESHWFPTQRKWCSICHHYYLEGTCFWKARAFNCTVLVCQFLPVICTLTRCGRVRFILVVHQLMATVERFVIRKIPITNPGLISVQKASLRAYLRGSLFSEGLIVGGRFAIQNGLAIKQLKTLG